MAMDPVSQEWWRDPRHHFGELTIDSPLLLQRDDIQPAVEFISTDLALPTHARILDLCCGPGRYAVELAHRGYDVVCLDINEQYIALARQLAAREGVQATFLTGDMREIPFESHFDAILNVGTSFGFFDREVENRRVIKAVAKALRSKGVFLLEMANRDYYLKNFTAKDWRRLENGRVLIIQREFDYVQSRIDAVFEMVGAEGVERWSHSWRAYTLFEVVGMLKQAGLALSRVYGGWKQSPYGVDSPRMLTTSERRGAA
jgi:SAM-dependent methyltransferase